jgi:hypothetical protein
MSERGRTATDAGNHLRANTLHLFWSRCAGPLRTVLRGQTSSPRLRFLALMPTYSARNNLALVELHMWGADVEPMPLRIDRPGCCKRLAANLGLLAYATVFCLSVAGDGVAFEHRQPVGSRRRDRSRPISGATRARLRTGAFPARPGSLAFLPAERPSLFPTRWCSTLHPMFRRRRSMRRRDGLASSRSVHRISRFRAARCSVSASTMDAKSPMSCASSKPRTLVSLSRIIFTGWSSTRLSRADLCSIKKGHTASCHCKFA